MSKQTEIEQQETAGKGGDPPPPDVVVSGEVLIMEAKIFGERLTVWGPNAAGKLVELPPRDGLFSINASDTSTEPKKLSVKIKPPAGYRLEAWRTEPKNNPRANGNELKKWTAWAPNGGSIKHGVTTDFKGGKKSYMYFRFFVVALPLDDNDPQQHMLVYDPKGRGGQF